MLLVAKWAQSSKRNLQVLLCCPLAKSELENLAISYGRGETEARELMHWARMTQLIWAKLAQGPRPAHGSEGGRSSAHRPHRSETSLQ